MRRARAFGLFLFDFVVGDDWRIALGVAGTLGLTAVAAGAGMTAWWIVPLATVGLLATSLRRASRP